MRCKLLFEPACGLRPPACKPSVGAGSGAASLFTGLTFNAELAEVWPPCSVSWSRDKARPGDIKALSGDTDIKVGIFDADNAAASSSGPSKVSTSVCRSTSKCGRSSPSPPRVLCTCESLGTLKSLGSERRPCSLENEWGMAHGPQIVGEWTEVTVLATTLLISKSRPIRACAPQGCSEGAPNVRRPQHCTPSLICGNWVGG